MNRSDGTGALVVRRTGAMMARQYVRSLVLACVVLVCAAHINSPDAWFDGPAGQYHVLVHVKPPAVVPGIAVISIKPDEKVDTVTAFVNKFDAVAGGPPPDVAKPVATEPGWYRTQLWVKRRTTGADGALGSQCCVVRL